MGYCFWSIVVYFEFCVEGIDGRCIEGGVCGVWREILEVQVGVVVFMGKCFYEVVKVEFVGVVGGKFGEVDVVEGGVDGYDVGLFVVVQYGKEGVDQQGGVDQVGL